MFKRVVLLQPLCYRSKYYSAKPAVEKLPKAPHIPVLLNESLSELELSPGNTLLDMTFGAGGHSLAALKSTPGLKIIALDRDPTANSHAKILAESYPDQVTPLLGKFSDLPELLKQKGIEAGSIDSMLFDLGCSSMQFDEDNRGFSISRNGPLDMRMNNKDSDQVTAADIIAHATEGDLWRIFKFYGDEKNCKLIARSIVESRYSIDPIKTTQQLAKLVEMTCGFSYRLDKLQRRAHVATKVFQALRIFVNNELNELNYGMLLAYRYLKVGGRVAAITFHSIEDRVVKRHFQDNIVDNAVSPLHLRYSSSALAFDMDEMKEFCKSRWEPVNRHIIMPSENEVNSNPRSRSAKLRVAIKTH